MAGARLRAVLLFATFLAGACANPTGSTTGTGKRLLLISFDGFRWDYDQDVDTPNLDRLARDGVKAKYITPPMLTMTSPSHFTTITGRPTISRTQSCPVLSSVLWRHIRSSPVVLYYGEPDNVGHTRGPDHPDRKAIIRQIDRTVGYLREAIGRHKLDASLNVIITSDHGMTTIKKRPLVDEIVLNKYLNLLKLASFEILDYGGFGILTPRPGKEGEVLEALAKAPNLTVYRKEDMPESFHLARSRRLPPVVVVADLGFNLNSRFIVYVNKGDHGFHNGEMDMKMIFRAFGPDFKKNFLAEPFDSVHIYPLMCQLLNIRAEPNNGSLEHITNMLITSHSGGPQMTQTSLMMTTFIFISTLML